MKKSAPQFASEELQQVISDMLVIAKKMGASSAEASLNKGFGYTVTVRKGETENIFYNNGKDVCVTVYFGHRLGTVSTSDISSKAINLALEKACYIARHTSEDVYSGLADPELMAYNYPDLDLYHPWDISVDQALELAKECEAYGFNHSNTIVNSEGVVINNSQTFAVYGNTHGFIGHCLYTSHNMNAALIAKQGEEMQCDTDFTAARSPDMLESAEILGKRVAQKTLMKLGARRITTRECPVIFKAEIAKTLWGSFLSAISGNNLYHKTSFLRDSMGKQVFAQHICIDEKPHILKALNSTPFDGEGVKLKDRSLVVDGILHGVILNSYTARKLKMQTTGNAGGAHNIFISTSDMDLDGLLKCMGTGLLVTELMGHGVNLINGDYSRGAFGFWVENGEIQYPVEGITIAGNLKDLFLNLVAVGNDVDQRGGVYTGSVWLPKMKVAGI